MNKAWIWIALDEITRQVVAFYIGDRGRWSAKKLLKQVLDLCSPLRVNTDHWRAYDGIFDASITHVKSKANTYLIESLNSSVRLFIKAMRVWLNFFCLIFNKKEFMCGEATFHFSLNDLTQIYEKSFRKENKRRKRFDYKIWLLQRSSDL